MTQRISFPEFLDIGVIGRWVAVGAMLLSVPLIGCGGCDDDSNKVKTQRCVDGVCGEGTEIPDPNEAGSCNEVCGGDQICREGRCCDVCASDSDCPTGEICGAERYCELQPSSACTIDLDCASRKCGDDGMCEAEQRCMESSECEGARICNLEGNCVLKCVHDQACNVGEVCLEGSCVVSGLCDADADCGEGGACVDGLCKLGCDYDFECGADATCFDEQCSWGCEESADCGSDGLCWRGACVTPSVTNPTVPDPAKDPIDEPVIDPDTPVEPDPVEPDPTNPDPVNPDMPDMPVEPMPVSCQLDSACGDQERCIDGACIYYGACQSDTQCFGDMVCDSGRCRDHCVDNSTCFNGELCGTDGKCAPAPVTTGGGDGGTTAPECLASVDCGACEACVGGVCEILPRICATDSQCGLEKDCEEGFCNFQCSDNSECPYSQICEQGVCMTDPTPSGSICAANAECADGTCVNGICFDACQNASDCGDMMLCDEGVCQPDWRPGFECRNNTDCPSDGVCVDGMCTVSCFRNSECRTGSCDSGYCTR